MRASGKISVLPVWKRGASLAERLEELACWVRANPEHFDRFVACFTEKMPNGNIRVRTFTENCDLSQQVGMFELGKLDCYEQSLR